MSFTRFTKIVLVILTFLVTSLLNFLNTKKKNGEKAFNLDKITEHLPQSELQYGTSKI